jgi:hypothetical protein
MLNRAPAHLPSKSSLFANDFHSLGLRDLLDARDQFHVHLAHKANVFATAVGRYLIREKDPDSKDGPRHGSRYGRERSSVPRRLSNSSARDWSWPCLLVFVSRWQTLAQLATHPEDVIPSAVYLPDGRIVPICVVEVETTAKPERTVNAAMLTENRLTVGSPLYVDAQGTRRMGTACCLVSDGSDFYVLTNTHLAGQTGRAVNALLRGLPRLVGSTHGTRNLTEKTFSEVYPELPGRDSVVNIDAALVRLKDSSMWKPLADTAMGAVADFSAQTASLSWIGQAVVGQGAASGRMEGQIKALFYRYKSIGGRDYVADLLIASRDGGKPLMTQPGDSGAMWCLDGVLEKNTLSPLAIEWGGQRMGSGGSGGSGGYLQLALATSMAVTLREMSLDIITDPSVERTQYWGPVGHFKIGQQACFLVKDRTLQTFFTNNINLISFSDDKTLQTATHLQAAEGFVPLSDVPDVVWKTNINRGKPEVARAQENWNHYADIDLPGGDGKTLAEMYEKASASLQPSVWLKFYGDAPLPSAAKKQTGKNNLGALPFRVWQIFARMLEYATTDLERFLTAAGVLAHYVGDACQPLHSSQHTDGLNGASTGVHSTYEDNMVDAKAPEIAAGLEAALKSLDYKPRPVRNPGDAAMAVMDLMLFAQKTLPPQSICEVYNKVNPNATHASKNAAVIDALWDSCGEHTIEVIAAGAVTLGALWQAAWTISGAEASSLPATAFTDQQAIIDIYEDKGFLTSLHLPYLGQKDLPGSDAPVKPPPPPAQKTGAKKGRKSVVKKITKKASKKSRKKAVKKAVKKAAR